MDCTVSIMATIRDRTLNFFRCHIWNPLNILAADGLWFPILIDDERQGIKQWEMVEKGELRRLAGGRTAAAAAAG